jgi:hypothetical protein
MSGISLIPYPSKFPSFWGIKNEKKEKKKKNCPTKLIIMLWYENFVSTLYILVQTNLTKQVVEGCEPMDWILMKPQLIDIW